MASCLGEQVGDVLIGTPAISLHSDAKLQERLTQKRQFMDMAVVLRATVDQYQDEEKVKFMAARIETGENYWRDYNRDLL